MNWANVLLFKMKIEIEKKNRNKIENSHKLAYICYLYNAFADVYSFCYKSEENFDIAYIYLFLIFVRTPNNNI